MTLWRPCVRNGRGGVGRCRVGRRAAEGDRGDVIKFVIQSVPLPTSVGTRIVSWYPRTHSAVPPSSFRARPSRVHVVRVAATLYRYINPPVCFFFRFFFLVFSKNNSCAVRRVYRTRFKLYSAHGSYEITVFYLLFFFFACNTKTYLRRCVVIVFLLHFCCTA